VLAALDGLAQIALVRVGVLAREDLGLLRRAAARLVLDEAARLTPPLELDYLALVDPDDFTEIGDDFTGEAVLAVAARVGATRLIDNITLTFGAAS
ncbi:pantoate--beta-alanine ligase, partial [Streptomyces nigra]